MARFATTLIDSMLAVIESTISLGGTAAPQLWLWSGTRASNMEDNPSGDLLAVLTMPTDWLGTPSNGTVAKAGAWSTAAALADGEASVYQIVGYGGTVWQDGTVSGLDGGGEIKLTTTSIVEGLPVAIDSFNYVGPNNSL